MTQMPVAEVVKMPLDRSIQLGGREFSMRVNPPSMWPDFMVGQTTQPVRVLLVDDDSHISHVIAQELLSDDRILLVAQAFSLKDGRRKVALHEFDVLLVDLNLGDGSGFDLIEQVKTMRPSTEIVVISALEDEVHAMRAFEMGVNGYLVKNSWFGNFPLAVLQVVNGGASITPNLARRLLHRLEAKPTERIVRGSRERLSDREREILRMVALGYTSSEIALRLVISSKTVNAHIRNIYQKLRVKNRAQAVSCAVDTGLL